jgi:hypothetical protein
MQQQQQQQSALAERDTLLHRKPATAGTAVSPSSSGPVTVTASGDSLAKLDRLDKRSDERFGKHDRGYAIDPVRRGRRRSGARVDPSSSGDTLPRCSEGTLLTLLICIRDRPRRTSSPRGARSIGLCSLASFCSPPRCVSTTSTTPLPSCKQKRASRSVQVEELTQAPQKTGSTRSTLGNLRRTTSEGNTSSTCTRHCQHLDRSFRPIRCTNTPDFSRAQSQASIGVPGMARRL